MKLLGMQCRTRDWLSSCAMESGKDMVQTREEGDMHSERVPLWQVGFLYVHVDLPHGGVLHDVFLRRNAVLQYNTVERRQCYGRRRKSSPF